MNYLDYPVFVCGHRKSGTTLAINLLDGLSNALVYPDDSGFFYMYHPRFSDSSAVLFEEAKNILVNKVVRENLTTIVSDATVPSEKRPELLSKVDAMAATIEETWSDDCSMRRALEVLITNFREIFYPDLITPNFWVEKTTSSELYANEIIEQFPNAKFIHIIRDPRDNWASLKSGWESRYQFFNREPRELLQSLLERGLLGMRMAVDNQKNLGPSRYKIVKFEDLAKSPEEELKSICVFLQSPFDSAVLSPTVLGWPWRGNNKEGRRFSRPESANVQRWRARIAEEEAQLIEYYFSGVMEKFDYTPFFSRELQQRAATNHYKWKNFVRQDD